MTSEQFSRHNTYLVVPFALLSASPATADKGNTCEGRQATILGTQGNDVVYGTAGNDVIVAFGGHDVIYAGAGNDIICANGVVRLAPIAFLVRTATTSSMVTSATTRSMGGAGNDYISGGNNYYDEIDGSTGRDTCTGGRISNCEV